MTPQERQLIAELFERLSSLETTPRDPAAERAIADGLARAPNAIYPLVQTVLVQDEALKRANDRIQELESGSADAPNENPGFLDSMRGALFGRDTTARGSVPSVSSSRPSETRPSETMQTMQGAPTAPYAGYGGPPPVMGGGGSFLGNAASTAAGVIGGSLLLGGIRSMFGEHRGAFGASEPERGERSPWVDNAGGSDLAKQAGIDDIGDSRDAHGEHSSAGLFDSADNDDDSDSDYDGDDSDDSGGYDDGGSDVA
jgi:uncharacterized protein